MNFAQAASVVYPGHSAPPAADPVAAPAPEAAPAAAAPAAAPPAAGPAHVQRERTEFADDIDEPNDEGTADSSSRDQPGAAPVAAIAAEVAPDLTVDERADFFRNARLDEIAPSSATDYGAVTRRSSDPKEQAFIDQALQSSVRMGIGVTTMAAIRAAAVDAARDPIRTTPAAAQAALQAEWGERYEAKMAAANAYIDEWAMRWPAVKPWLQLSALGNSPAFIKTIAGLAAARRGR